MCIRDSSKSQIIIQAFKFHSQGNILEAAKYYQSFIDKGFKDYRVFGSSDNSTFTQILNVTSKPFNKTSIF